MWFIDFILEKISFFSFKIDMLVLLGFAVSLLCILFKTFRRFVIGVAISVLFALSVVYLNYCGVFQTSAELLATFGGFLRNQLALISSATELMAKAFELVPADQREEMLAVMQSVILMSSTYRLEDFFAIALYNPKFYIKEEEQEKGNFEIELGFDKVEEVKLNTILTPLQYGNSLMRC